MFIAQLNPTLCDPMECSRRVPLSIGFSRQEYWRGLPFPSPGDLPDPGIIPVFPALAGGFYRATREAPCKGIKSFIEWNTKLNNQDMNT